MFRTYKNANGESFLISDYPKMLNMYVENPFNCKECNGKDRVLHDVFKTIDGKLVYQGRICDKCLDKDYVEVIRNGKKQ